MTGRPFMLGARGGNPLLQILSLLVAGVLLVGAVIMGAVVLVALLSLGIVAGLVLAARGWWLRRTLGRGTNAAQSRSPDTRGPYLIEGEYEVIDERDTERPRRPK